jgi:hypothetical protein
MNRGDHQEDIFHSNKDRELFLATLDQACAKTDWQIHAWCLMRNHFHLVVETPRANLVDGSEAFRRELLARVCEKAGAEHYGEEVRESAEAKGVRIIQEGLERLGWPEAELIRRRKGDPVKLQIALRLRRETTMTLEWIAQRLAMGTKTHLSHLLYWQGRERRKKRRS